MKYIVTLFVVLYVTITASAQSNFEAKALYQLAEEKFNARQYTDALDYLEKAETALGSVNLPMLFLKVMITDQILTVKESIDNYQKLEKAIADFDKHKDKNALGEDKLMDVYRIKMDLDKRKNAYEKKIVLKEEYDKMLYRLASEFPKTETNVSDLFTNVQVFWQSFLSAKEVKKSGKKPEWLVKRMIKEGGWNYFDREDIQKDQYVLKAFKTYKPNEDRVEEYDVSKILNLDKKSIKRPITVEEICSVLNITPNMWFSFTAGDNPLIKTNDKAYSITKMIAERGVDGERKYFAMYIYKETYINRDSEDMWINIYKNTF